jgi:hypothetical protein
MDQKLNEYKIEESKEDIQEIKGTVKDIFSILGGKEGLVAQNAVNTSAIKRIWWVFLIVFTFIGIIIRAI